MLRYFLLLAFNFMILQFSIAQNDFLADITFSDFINGKGSAKIPNLKKMTAPDSDYFGVFNEVDSFFSGYIYQRVRPLWMDSESTIRSGFDPQIYVEIANRFNFNTFLNVKKKNGKYNFINLKGREVFKNDIIAGEPLGVWQKIRYPLWVKVRTFA